MTLTSSTAPSTELIPDGVRRFLDAGPSKLYIDGSWVAPSGGDYSDAINPSTVDVLRQVARGTATDVDAAVQAAKRALKGEWRNMHPLTRGKLIDLLADNLEANLDEFAHIETLDTGKPLASARGDVALAVSTLRFYAGAPVRLRGTTGSTTPDHHSYVRREPVGVSGLIGAWNFPLVIAIWKSAPALAAGTTFVLKPAEQTSLSTIRLVQAMDEVGFPRGVANLVTGGGGTVGNAIVEHPDVAKISFTGSTEVGQGIQRAAAATSKRLTLEMGGKSAHIVFEDADIDAAVANADIAAFANSGQICISGNRLFVQRSILETFLERFAAAAENHVLGDGMDAATTLGPLVSEQHFATVSKYLEIGRSAGYRVVAGGTPLDRPGYFVPPTIFADVGNTDTLATEEVFGPVVTVTAFDTEEEAIALANQSTYGLGAGIWTESLSRAHRVAAELEAGTVWVNTYLDIDPAMPYGGFKQSGIGRDLGDASVEGFTELKSVIIQL